MSLNGQRNGLLPEGHGEEWQESSKRLMLVMCDMKKGAFDFIGEELSRLNPGNVRLRNALVLAYGQKLVLERLDDLHVPKGMIDLAYVETVVEIPAECVAYTVTFPADSACELARMYTDFFTVPVH